MVGADPVLPQSDGYIWSEILLNRPHHVQDSPAPDAYDSGGWFLRMWQPSSRNSTFRARYRSF